MSVDEMMYKWFTHVDTIIEIEIVIFIFLMVLVIYFMLKRDGSETAGLASGEASQHLKEIEESLKKVLSTSQLQNGGVGLGGETGSVGALEELGALRTALKQREQDIAGYEKLLAEANASGSAELEEKVNELEARLLEYEIIEDDIADLSLFKEENIRLNAEVQSLREQMAAGNLTPIPTSAAQPEVQNVPFGGMVGNSGEGDLFASMDPGTDVQMGEAVKAQAVTPSASLGGLASLASSEANVATTEAVRTPDNTTAGISTGLGLEASLNDVAVPEGVVGESGVANSVTSSDDLENLEVPEELLDSGQLLNTSAKENILGLEETSERAPEEKMTKEVSDSFGVDELKAKDLATDGVSNEMEAFALDTDRMLNELDQLNSLDIMPDSRLEDEGIDTDKMLDEAGDLMSESFETPAVEAEMINESPIDQGENQSGSLVAESEVKLSDEKDVKIVDEDAQLVEQFKSFVRGG